MGTTPPFTHVGLAIKLLRTRAGLQAAQLAEMSGVTRAQLSKYECGHQRPALESLDRIMVALGINIYDLGAALEEVERSVALAGGESSADKGGAEEKTADEEAARRREARKRVARKFAESVERWLEQLERDLREEREEDGA